MTRLKLRISGVGNDHSTSLVFAVKLNSLTKYFGLTWWKSCKKF